MFVASVLPSRARCGSCVSNLNQYMAAIHRVVLSQTPAADVPADAPPASEDAPVPSGSADEPVPEAKADEAATEASPDMPPVKEKRRKKSIFGSLFGSSTKEKDEVGIENTCNFVWQCLRYS